MTKGQPFGYTQQDVHPFPRADRVLRIRGVSSSSLADPNEQLEAFERQRVDRGVAAALKKLDRADLPGALVKEGGTRREALGDRQGPWKSRGGR